MKILFLSRWYPYPPTNGSKLRIRGILESLRRRHEVTLVSFAEPDEAIAGVPAAAGQTVRMVRRKPFNPSSTRALLGFLRVEPRSVIDTYSSEMEEVICEELAKGDYSLVVASQIDMAAYSRRFGGVPALLEEIELGVLYERYVTATSGAARMRNGLTWFKHRAYVRSVLNSFQACTVASARERDLLAGVVGSGTEIAVVPNSIDRSAYEGVTDKQWENALIFTGSFSFGPNYEAMDWFVREVFPQVRTAFPDARLIVTGDHGGRTLSDMTGVTLTGMVDDVRPWIASATVSLAPIFTGGGSRLKILEAMALRTPVAATSKGAEGLDAQDGEHLLVADAPQDFADAVISLLQSASLRERLAENAFLLVRDRYDSQVVNERLVSLAERVAAGAPAREQG